MKTLNELKILHTSDKLRYQCKEIIQYYGKPLAPIEIETYIRMNNYSLYIELQTKCKDYIRIILSQNKNNDFVKYKSLLTIKGIDKRTIFFGLPNIIYSELEWKILLNEDNNINEKDDEINIWKNWD